MSKSRIISIAVAVLVAILIMNLGKSCAEDITRTNRENAKPTAASPNYNYAPDNGGNDSSPVYDETIPPTDEEPTEHIEYVTSILGEIIGTLPSEENISELPTKEVIEETTPPSILGNDTPAEPATSPYSILQGENSQQATEPAVEQIPQENDNVQSATVADGFVIRLD